jgi:cell shape-determining protein MreC
MKKFSKEIAKIGLVLCSILLIFSVIFNDFDSLKFYCIFFVVNLVTLFLDRIMEDIQKILDVIYNYIK